MNGKIFFFELHRLFSKTQKRIDHQELLLTKERIDYLSAAGEKHSQTLQLLLQELLTIQSKLQQTIMSQLETFSLADRIVFVRLFQFLMKLNVFITVLPFILMIGVHVG